MSENKPLSQRVTALLVYGRSPLVFGGLICAVGVMWTNNPVLYTFGVSLLFVSMSFDLVDGWFSARFQTNQVFAQLAEKLMDKIVYSIIFPLVAVGEMWRLYAWPEQNIRTQLLHAIFILLLCVTVLVRDNFAHFMRGFALRKGQEPEPNEFIRLRTIVAAPVGAILYAQAFYVPEGPPSELYFFISWLGNIPLRALFLIEIGFLVINLGSIARYCRKYGTLCLDELCLGDEKLRRRILSIFPNALTIMNALMGLLAVFFAYQLRVREAYLILIGAAIFDKFDGAVARRLGLTEPLPGAEHTSHVTLGGIMDDISDGVSFCIAPAWIFYIVMSECSLPEIVRLPFGLIALLYGGLGIARLIYFTIDRTPVPGFFKGMPTPAAALFVCAPMIMLAQALKGTESSPILFWGYFCFGIMIVAAVLMNLYPVHYIHVGRLMDRRPWFGRSSLLLLVAAVITKWLGFVAFAYLFLYSLSPLITWKIDPTDIANGRPKEKKQDESRPDP